MTIVEPINFVDGSDPGVAIKKVRPANTDLTFLAGALGIEPRSAVLETAILTAVLCPFTIDYCTIPTRRIDTSPEFRDPAAHLLRGSSSGSEHE